MNDRESLELFRHELCKLFPKESAAIMNLIDALSSYGHQCNSVVKLSQAPCFPRTYNSITKAIYAAAGCDEKIKTAITTLLSKPVLSAEVRCHCWAIDATPQPRQYAKKLADKKIVHLPNPSPGNKPIGIGHEYSAIVALRNIDNDTKQRWAIAMGIERVPSTQKGNEVGMRQFSEFIHKAGIVEKLNISFADSLYGTNVCRSIVVENDNHVHIFRLRISRNLFYRPTSGSEKAKGRHQEYGKKVRLSHPEDFDACDNTISIKFETAKGKHYTAKIRCWHNMLIRGSRSHHSSEHPINAIQVEVFDEEGSPVFKRPLWIGVLGKRRHEISLEDAYTGYCSRYDIEHFFRFMKNNLHLDGYQTPEVKHEEAFAQLCMIAQNQLYQARNIVSATPYPWERYLPAYKNKTSGDPATPSQTQRGFGKLLEEIGTPAAPCVQRGTPIGRIQGTILAKRLDQPVKFKGKQKVPRKEGNVSACENTAEMSEQQKIEELVKTVTTTLNRHNFSPQTFADLLLTK